VRKSGQNGYTSGDAKKHIEKKHGDNEGSHLVAAKTTKCGTTMREGVVAYGKRKNAENVEAVQRLFASKQQKVESRAMPTEAQQVAAQARIYFYHPGSIGKNFFEDPSWRQYAALMAGGRVPAIVSREALPGLAKAEWQMVQKVIRKMCCSTATVLNTEPFVQVCHDGVTCSNHQKYQSMGITFFFEGRCWTVAVGFVLQGESGTAEAVSALVRERIEDITGGTIANRVNGFIQDAAATRVATMFNEDASNGAVAKYNTSVMEMVTNICGLHDFIKPAEYITTKWHSRKQVKVDFSQVAIDGWLRAVKLSNYYSYSHRSVKLMQSCEKMSVPSCKPTSTINGTRMTTVQEGMKSLLVIAIAIIDYFQTKLAALELTEAFVSEIVPSYEQWDLMAVQEALVGVFVHVARVSQLENGMLRAIHRYLLLLTKGGPPTEIHVLQWKTAAGKGKCLREKVPTASLTGDGKEIFNALEKELTKRYAGLKQSDEAIASVFIDHRTSALVQRKKLVTDDERAKATEYLMRRYVAHVQSLHEKKLVEISRAKMETGMGGGASTPVTAPAGVVPAAADAIANDFDDVFGTAPEAPPALNEIVAWSEADALAALAVAKRTFANWEKLQPPFRELLDDAYATKMPKYPTGHALAGQVIIASIDDLMHVRLEEFYYRLIAEKQPPETDFNALGFWPIIAISMLTGVMSSGFVERVNSAANDTMTDERTRLNADEFEVAVLLRINRKFIEYLKNKFQSEFA
jgi:hypothetical protein